MPKKDNIFRSGGFASLFNGIKTLVFQFGSGVKGKSGVVVQRDGRLNTGGGKANLDLALNVLRDPFAQACFDRLMEVISSFPATVEAASDSEEDEEAAEDIREYFLKKDSIFQTSVEALGLAKITGVSAIENNYQLNSDGIIVVGSVLPIDVDRIIYHAREDLDNYVLHIQTFNKPFDGEPAPYQKMVDFKYFSVYISNPYGMGVGSQLIDVITYKERLVELWIRIAEQYSSPVKIAKVPDSAEVTEVDEFFSAFKKMSEGSTFVLPPGFELDVKDISKTGAESLLQNLVDYADSQIAALILGENITGKEIANGAQARDKIASNITNRKALSLANAIASRLNETTVKWLTLMNHPNATPPKIVFTETTDLDALASRLVSLNQLGVKISDVWVEETFGIVLDRKPVKGFGGRDIEFEERVDN